MSNANEVKFKVSGFGGSIAEGTLGRPKKEEQFVKNDFGKDKRPYKRLNFSVTDNNKGCQYLELFGVQSEKIKFRCKYPKANNKEEFEYVMEELSPTEVYGPAGLVEKYSAAATKKYTVSWGAYLEDDVDGKKRLKYTNELEFVDAFTYAKVLEKLLPELMKDGKKFKVLSNPRPNRYNGKTSLRYEPVSIKEIIKENEDMLPHIEVTLPIVCQKGVLDKDFTLAKIAAMAKVDRKFEISVFTQIWNNNNQENELVPFNCLIDLTDTDDELLGAIIDVYTELFNKNDVGESIKSKKYYQGLLQMKIINKTVAVELTESEKKMIRIGMATEEQLIREKTGKYAKANNELVVYKLKSDGLLSEIEVDENRNFFVDEIDEVQETGNRVSDKAVNSNFEL